MSNHHNLPRRITQTEQAISASDERLLVLRHALLNAARSKLQIGRKHWVLGVVIVVVLGVALYPIRRPLLRHARVLLASPALSMFVRRLPLAGALLPLLLNSRTRSARGLLMWAASTVTGLVRRR